jgi:hypothetical protein
MTLNDYIEIFNNHGFSGTLVKVFNNLKSFLRVVVKKERQSEIDLESIDYTDFTQNDNLFEFLDENGFLYNADYDNFEDSLKNYYLEFWINKDPDAAFKYICDNLLTDVEIRQDGFWLKLAGREELANFYEPRGRDGSPRNLAKEAFSEEGLDFDRYWDTTSDVYSDVIEDLDEANTQHLANYILKIIGDQDLNVEDYQSDFFHELAEIQARGEFFQITSENVYDLIKDSEAMNEEMDGGDLSDLKSELYSIHANAYNSAYESEIYELIYGGLDEFFSSKIENEQIKRGDKTIYVEYIRIRDFKSNIMEFIDLNKGYSYNDSVLEYFGDYSTMMKGLIDDDNMDGIDFRIPDYADWDLTKKYINEFFTDYI